MIKPHPIHYIRIRFDQSLNQLGAMLTGGGNLHASIGLAYTTQSY